MKRAALSDEERLGWHRLAQSENVGPVTFQQLLLRFGTASAALEAVPELSRRGGLRRALKLYDATRAQVDFDNATRLGARYIAICEPDYPDALRQSPAPPPLICVKGNVDVLQRKMLAVVGARNAAALSLRFTRQISGELGAAGFTIVSGLARGIDTAAHQASLASGTVAVVAGGVDHIYPPENADLHTSIGERGLLLSEMPPGTVPKAESFPRRNRIIAGLGEATLIMEAALRSGSLSTARFATEAGRDVFAVPGSPLDPRCEGTNGLIKDGAHVLTRASDVLEELHLGMPTQGQLFEDAAAISFPESSASSENARNRLLGLLSPSPIASDELLREAGVAPEQGQGMLIELELAGELMRLPGGRVSRA